MKWVWIVLAILLVLILLGVPKGSNDTITTTVSGPPTILQPQKEIKRAAEIAEDYWGGTRCLHINYHYRDLPGRAIAKARWYSSRLASKTYFQCSITFDTKKIRISFPLYCSVVVHEFGHLSGYKGPKNQFHSIEPANVMYSEMSAQNTPKVCKIG